MNRFLRFLCLCLGGILLIVTVPIMVLHFFATPQWMLYANQDLDSRTLIAALPDGTFPREMVQFRNRASRYMGISNDGEWAYFEDSIDGINNIYRYHMIDGREEQLTFDPEHAHFEAWSPDKEWIIYTARYNDNNREIFRIHRTGGKAQDISQTHGWDNFVAFSEDGKWMYFSTRNQGRFELRRIPADGGEAEFISFYDERAVFRSWTSDGEWMILEYQYGQFYDRRLFRLRVDGELQPLSPQTQWDIFAGWSPDKQWLITLSSMDYEKWTAYQMRSDGSDYQELAPQYRDVYFESFSPDGDWVFFSTGIDSLDLYRMPFSQTPLTPEETADHITSFQGDQAIKTWTPDGKWLIYKTYIPGGTQLVRAQADGSHLEPIVEFKGQTDFLGWSPYLDRRVGWVWLVGAIVALLGLGVLWGGRLVAQESTS